ncbi:MAG: hypothetical protein KBA81_08145 [Rhabdochlamydiaceae bacterium]|nr:hypothetical protein [Rhabdochlamydiaceae bacterium]
MAQTTSLQNHTDRVVYNQYLTTLTAERQTLIANIANSVGCIFTEDGQVNGSALLIHKNLILVPKHCFPFERGKIFFKALDRFILATTFLDGEKDPPAPLRSNFKILFVPDQNLTPAPLTLESSNGEGVQFNYHIDGNFYALFYRTPKTASIYVKNSDSAHSITLNGDAGGARYSWNCQGVTSIHQGEKGVLTINQVYHVVNAIFSSKKVGDVKRKAAFALNSLQETLVDQMILKMDAKPSYLQPDQTISGRYGLFQAHEVATENVAYILNETKKVINKYLEYICNSRRKRDGFFNRMLGVSGTMHYIPNKKLKIASIVIGDHPVGASKILIQIGGQAVATVEVEDSVAQWAASKPDRISALVHYIVHQFWRSLRTNQPNVASVRRISLRE